MGKGDGSQKVSINSPKKAKWGGGAGTYRGLKWDTQVPGASINLEYMMYCGEG